MKKIKSVVWAILNISNIGPLLQLHLLSSLKEEGWFLSFRKKKPVNKQGQPIPWYSYSVIHFLEERLDKSFRVYEFGAGYSSLWYAKRVSYVDAVEGDKAWVDLLKPQLPPNVHLVFQEVDSEAYVNGIAGSGYKYDIVVVDGRRRVDCVKNTPNCLTEKGVVILDNSEREEYREAIEFLKQLGFKQIQICGMVPIVAHATCTSIFYRPNNCLNI